MKSWLACTGFIFVSALLSLPAFSQERSLRFFGNGHLFPGKDRVKVALTEGAAVNVSDDFTIEFWIKCEASENMGNVSAADHGDGWITGNVVLDRDVYGNADPGDFGLAIGSAPGLPFDHRVVAFGINRKDSGITIQGKKNIADKKWHHIAVTRDAASGRLALFIDGTIDAEGNGPAGNVNYAAGRNSSHPESDPFLVIGAEKHDGGEPYPSYSGYLDELRLSDMVRYRQDFSVPSGKFTRDANTAALYHFDEGKGERVIDAATGSHGVLFAGGEPAGPAWREDSPFFQAAKPAAKESPTQKSVSKVRPYRISQQGTSLLLTNTDAIRTLVVWNREGKRLVERSGIHAGTSRVELNQNRGIAFILITLEDGSRFTEKVMIH
jgi:hypothetical protein